MTVFQSEVHTQFGPVNRKGNTERDGGKEERSAEGSLLAIRKRVIPTTSGIAILRIFLSTYQIRCALRALNEAALLATIWNLRRATKIHGDIFVSNAHQQKLDEVIS